MTVRVPARTVPITPHEAGFNAPLDSHVIYDIDLEYRPILFGHVSIKEANRRISAAGYSFQVVEIEHVWERFDRHSPDCDPKYGEDCCFRFSGDDWWLHEVDAGHPGAVALTYCDYVED